MKNKNKYLFILPTDKIGGAERVVKNIISYLLTINNNHITLIFLSGGNRGYWDDLSYNDNIECVYIKASSELSSLFKTISKLYYEKKCYDFAYTTHTHVNSLVSILRKINIIKSDKHIIRESTVIFDRFFGLKRLLMKFLYFLYRDFDLIICQTEYMKKRLVSEISRFGKTNIQVIRNPLNIKYIDEKLCEKSVFERRSNFEIIYVGRLIDIKNVSLLLYSLTELKKTTNDFNLKILGDGNNRISLELLSSELGIEQHVEFIGNVDNPYIYMKEADLGVLTSKKEGFPNVVIEMMASGTNNIITTPCAGDLDSLPSVHVLDDFDINTMSSKIISVWKSTCDNTTVYREFSESIDVYYFVNSIFNKV
ncbi:glycosyltransferase [Photobacterium leiognathi]|uniref:glycosyltransferase n=1 Tax=Photobacterium leiognathi TaxID=553611 RepID=UPI000D15E06E|nr:glycosyltransferase [Photobacterium leiognathi]PSW57451.1 hypothetical protein C0W50_07680 [Photobacterium leiognathi subsp. mandapamensis]